MAQIILWSDFIKERKKWLSGFLAVVVMLATTIGVLVFDRFVLKSQLKSREALVVYNAELLLKEEIYRLLKPRGVSVGQALEVADAVIDKSKEKDIPATTILGIMKTESSMKHHAKSHRGAMGLMQIWPPTWDTYVKKLGLKVSRQAAYDPYTNILVATEVLSDLREHYTKKGLEDRALWEHILSAYYSGIDSTSRGITGDKKRYVLAVQEASYVR